MGELFVTLSVADAVAGAVVLLFWGKTKKIKQISMSTSSATKKTEIWTQDVLTQLDEAVHKTPCVSLALVESTDVCDTAQLLVYVRFFNKGKKEFCEDLLDVTPLQYRPVQEERTAPWP